MILASARHGFLRGRDGPAPKRSGQRKNTKCKSYQQALARARAHEAFYDPAIEDDADVATDYALKQTGGSAKYRGVWRFYCLQIGINTFLEQLNRVLSCYRQGELRFPARAFHARIRNMKTKLDEAKGGAR